MSVEGGDPETWNFVLVLSLITCVTLGETHRSPSLSLQTVTWRLGSGFLCREGRPTGVPGSSQGSVWWEEHARSRDKQSLLCVGPNQPPDSPTSQGRKQASPPQSITQRKTRRQPRTPDQNIVKKPSPSSTLSCCSRIRSPAQVNVPCGQPARSPLCTPPLWYVSKNWFVQLARKLPWGEIVSLRPTDPR